MPARPDLLVDPAFGGELRQLRVGREVTVRQLATDVHVGHATISGLENGSRRPSRAMAEHLDQVLDADGTLLALVHDAGTSDGDGADRISHALRRPGRFDAGAADALATALAAHRRLDDVVDAAALLPLAGPQHDLVVTLAREARGPHATTAQRVAAESLQFTGWLHAQLGRHGAADRAYAASVAHALDAGSPGLASQSARFRGSLALQTGRHLAMVRHYRAAAATPGAGVLHRVDAMLRTAHGLAVLGDGDGARAQLHAASTLNDHAGTADPEPFAYWLSSAWLRFPLGLAYLELGEHDRAADELRAGLDALPDDWRAASWTTVYADALDRAESGAADAGA